MNAREHLTYKFDRYRRGKPMAEDIEIAKASNLEDAMLRAARLAQRGDVLVLRNGEQAARADERRKTLEECAEWIDRRIAQGDIGGPGGSIMADMELRVAAEHFRALAGKKEGA